MSGALRECALSVCAHARNKESGGAAIAIALPSYISVIHIWEDGRKYYF